MSYFLVTGLLSSALSFVLLVVLSPLILFNFFFHRRNLRRLDEEEYEDLTSSEEFSARADVCGGLLRIIVMLPFAPAIHAGDLVMKCLEGGRA
ncbi:hypothetical protein KJ937_03020 [Patescibacteria group bacterium]|nr:hypothetical protein [Patescibacteria group bacterium]